MKYEISTKDAAALIDKIYSCVKNRKDDNGQDIKTWFYKLNDKNEVRYVHTTDQWEKKCCIELSASENNDKVIAKFYYWSKFKEADRTGTESQYVFGRLTELILVHFFNHVLNISIKK